MSDGILDESKAFDVLELSLADRMRHIDTIEDSQTDTLWEAAEVLHACLDLLYGLPGALSIRADELYRELIRPHLMWSADSGRPVCDTATIVGILRTASAGGSLGDSPLPLGYLFVASLLEEADAVLREIAGPEARDLYDRVSAKKIQRLGVAANLHQVSCDYVHGDGPYAGLRCWQKSPGAINREEAERYAVVNGWLVSEERDLCPTHAGELGIEPAGESFVMLPPGPLEAIPDPELVDAQLLSALEEFGVLTVRGRQHGHAEFNQIIGLAYQCQISGTELGEALGSGLTPEQRLEARDYVALGHRPSADHEPYATWALVWLAATNA